MARGNVLVGAAVAAGAGLISRLVRGARPADPGLSFDVVKSAAAWRQQLSPEAFRVLREHGTEPPWTSPLNQNKEAGVYACAGCAQDLFRSTAKFDSGTGWPSFYAPIEGAIETAQDRSLFVVRTEVHCSRCGGHQGHVFEDGPPPTGRRYCINGVALTFRPATEQRKDP